jgi:ribosomal protein S18 acetylase RimI-like enzyme
MKKTTETIGQNEMKIRKLTINDVEALISLYGTFWGEKSDRQKMESKLQDLENNPSYIFLCAEKENKVIGTIQGIICEELYGTCQPFLLMDNFVIDEKYRKQGVGKTLLNSLEKIAKNRGCTQLLFITESSRINSIKFYESVGYCSKTHIGFKKSLK